MFAGKRQSWQRCTKPALPLKAPEPSGLGLAGLMAWLVFLVIVLVTLVATSNWARMSGRDRLSRQSLAHVAHAVLAYKQATGEFPPAVSSNAELIKYLNSAKPSKDRIDAMPQHILGTTTKGKEILDAWGRPLRYVFDAGAGATPELISNGPDTDDPTDDIYNETLKTASLESSTEEPAQ